MWLGVVTEWNERILRCAVGAILVSSPDRPPQVFDLRLQSSTPNRWLQNRAQNILTGSFVSPKACLRHGKLSCWRQGSAMLRCGGGHQSDGRTRRSVLRAFLGGLQQRSLETARIRIWFLGRDEEGRSLADRGWCYMYLFYGSGGAITLQTRRSWVRLGVLGQSRSNPTSSIDSFVWRVQRAAPITKPNRIKAGPLSSSCGVRVWTRFELQAVRRSPSPSPFRRCRRREGVESPDVAGGTVRRQASERTREADS